MSGVCNSFLDGLVEIKRCEFVKDSRGDLFFFEDFDADFSCARIYFFEMSSESGQLMRGGHAHLELVQNLFVVKGSLNCLVAANGKSERFKIDTGDSVSLKPVVWRELRPASLVCQVFVLASQKFVENDYIRSYEAFSDKYMNVSGDDNG